MTNTTIGLRYLSSIGLFNQLCNYAGQPTAPYPDLVGFLSIQHELEKFQIWAGDINAQGTGRASLEVRLQGSSDSYEAIVDLLDDLKSRLLKC